MIGILEKLNCPDSLMFIPALSSIDIHVIMQPDNCCSRFSIHEGALTGWAAFSNSNKRCSMLFLSGLFVGVIVGFLIAGLCNIAAEREEMYNERRSASLETKIEEVA
jgi:hypothetical protein